MTTRISKEWKYPLEEVASWSWKKKETYAIALSELNQYDREMAEEQADTEGQGMGGGDTHPHLAQYENVSKMH